MTAFLKTPIRMGVFSPMVSLMSALISSIMASGTGFSAFSSSFTSLLFFLYPLPDLPINIMLSPSSWLIRSFTACFSFLYCDNFSGSYH